MKTLKTLLLSALLLAGASAARAQDKPIELSFSHFLPQSFILFQRGVGGSIQEWADSIEKASNGTIKMKFYPAQQLGTAPAHYDLARDGIADIAFLCPGYTPGRFPVSAAAELPFMFNTGDGGSKALDTWYRKYAGKEMEQVKYLFSIIHNPGTFYTRKQVKTPEELKGMQLRASTGTMGKWISQLGGNAVFVAPADLLDALNKGVADGITFAAEAGEQWGYLKVVPYGLDMPMYTTHFAVVMNRAKYRGLSAAQRKVIDDHSTPEWAHKIAAPWHAADEKMKASFKTRTDRFLTPVPASELARWKKLAEPLEAGWADDLKKKNASYDPKAVMAELRKTIAEIDKK